MKLLYFWFEEYKQLNDFEANLGSEFSFHFNENRLTINDNKIFIKDFFKLPDKEYSEDTKLIDISAIVGENGSGKSTILDFLSELMSKNSINFDYILVYSIDDKLHIFSTIQNMIVFENNTSRAIYFCISPLNLQNHLTLLFSNVFDARSIGMLSDIDKTYYKNISTNYLISRDKDISNFLRSEFEKQIFFIHEYKEQLNIQNIMKIPSKIFLGIKLDSEAIVYTNELEDAWVYLRNDEVAMDYLNYSAPNEFYKSFYSNCLRLFLVHIEFLIGEYQVKDSVKNNYEDFLYYYSPNDHGNIFDCIYLLVKDDIPEGYFESSDENMLIKYNVLDDQNTLEKHEIAKRGKLESFYTKLFILKENFKEICRCFGRMKFSDIDTKPYILTDSSETENFITLYQKTFSKVGCLEFTWSDMSSGEYGMLSLFSRFHHILQVLKREQDIFGKDIDEVDFSNSGFNTQFGELNFEEDNATFPNSYLLLIDEGDLYFHPQWQKDWLHYFIKLSEVLFNGNIQIILTTHSPFVLSDFPNTNVVFLQNNNQVNVSSAFLEGSPKTFAANIIELFSNSFFIKDGLIGSFAKRKINLFIQNLLKLTPEEVYLHREEIKRFIDTIGEPLIRNKTLQIYHGKLELHDDFDIGRRIMLLEQELQNLKTKRKL
ncbi:AAA family ATPase [Bacillus cereus]|uniref:AAA family ATPase n=1 Tax=Bacillus cereus TaxID=1396 RepID=UPI000C283EA9|nr:AAA family ATPase [Bacillus cereus]